MNVKIMMGHVNDIQNLKVKDEALREALAWVRHWKTDYEFGMTPTEDSLIMVEAVLSSALQAAE